MVSDTCFAGVVFDSFDLNSSESVTLLNIGDVKVGYEFLDALLNFYRFHSKHGVYKFIYLFKIEIFSV